MNSTDLLDDALGDLEPSRLADLDRACAADDSLAARRAEVARVLETLLDDGDEGLEPPPGLAHRTLAQVRRLATEGPRLQEYAPSQARWRWSDFAVAAGILIAGLLTLVPALHSSRLEMAQTLCLNNLRQIGLALNQYAMTNRSFPYVEPSEPGSYVGSYAILLRDGRYLPDCSILDCPLTGAEGVPTLPRFKSLCEAERKAPGLHRASMPLDYAYHQGWRDNGDEPAPPPYDGDDSVPLLADRPDFVMNGPVEAILPGNSPNHGRRGQNVLFTGGHAAWHNSRRIGPLDADLYLNAHNRLAPGLHDHDAVLTPAVYRFSE